MMNRKTHYTYFHEFLVQENRKRMDEIRKAFAILSTNTNGDDNATQPITTSVDKPNSKPFIRLVPETDEEDLNNKIDELWINIGDSKFILVPEDHEDNDAEVGKHDDDINEPIRMELEQLSEDDQNLLDDKSTSEYEVTEETEEENEEDKDKIIDTEKPSETTGDIEKIGDNLEQGLSISEEILQEIAELPQHCITALLQKIKTSITAIQNLCLLCEQIEEKKNTILLAQLCSQILLPQAQEGHMEGSLLESVCRLANQFSKIVVPHLLLPLLTSDLALASKILTVVNQEKLNYATLNVWPVISTTELSEEELILLKFLLETPLNSAVTIARLCLIFAQTGAAFATSNSYSKLILQFVKNLPKASLTEVDKQNLTLAITSNKTVLKKVIEKLLSNM